ncbi:hypothetical protein CYMTET_50179 [Cymbomonas tetramitiformis]|uniref:PCIF1 WW domain-containing protein n=1 Tax=Cymbomonas tetramitiformis TaxID=36881 RepID=A0AAE0BNR0_9CHLO|nr:hypothetical protein CYMTET_50179 [Cymbomonas tetramitiformis]
MDPQNGPPKNPKDKEAQDLRDPEKEEDDEEADGAQHSEDSEEEWERVHDTRESTPEREQQPHECPPPLTEPKRADIGEDRLHMLTLNIAGQSDACLDLAEVNKDRANNQQGLPVVVLTEVKHAHDSAMRRFRDMQYTAIGTKAETQATKGNERAVKDGELPTAMVGGTSNRAATDLLMSKKDRKARNKVILKMRAYKTTKQQLRDTHTGQQTLQNLKQGDREGPSDRDEANTEEWLEWLTDEAKKERSAAHKVVKPHWQQAKQRHNDKTVREYWNNQKRYHKRIYAKAQETGHAPTTNIQALQDREGNLAVGQGVIADALADHIAHSAPYRMEHRSPPNPNPPPWEDPAQVEHLTKAARPKTTGLDLTISRQRYGKAGILALAQEGSREKRNTLRQLTRVTNAIEDANVSGQELRGLYVDFENAYGSVDQNKLLHIMEYLGIPEDLTQVAFSKWSELKISLTKSAVTGIKNGVQICEKLHADLKTIGLKLFAHFPDLAFLITPDGQHVLREQRIRKQCTDAALKTDKDTIARGLAHLYPYSCEAQPRNLVAPGDFCASNANRQLQQQYRNTPRAGPLDSHTMWTTLPHLSTEQLHARMAEWEARLVPMEEIHRLLSLHPLTRISETEDPEQGHQDGEEGQVLNNRAQPRWADGMDTMAEKLETCHFARGQTVDRPKEVVAVRTFLVNPEDPHSLITQYRTQWHHPEGEDSYTWSAQETIADYLRLAKKRGQSATTLPTLKRRLKMRGTKVTHPKGLRELLAGGPHTGRACPTLNASNLTLDPTETNPEQGIADNREHFCQIRLEGELAHSYHRNGKYIGTLTKEKLGRLHVRYIQAVGTPNSQTPHQSTLRTELWEDHKIRVSTSEEEIGHLLIRYSSKEEKEERKKNLQNHWTFPAQMQRALQQAFGISTELFASPLNIHHNTSSYFAKYERDKVFGARGSA